MLILEVVLVISVAVVRAEMSCDCGPSLLPCNSLWFEHKLYISMDEVKPNGHLLINPLGIYRLMMILAEVAVGPTKETIQKSLFVAIWFLKVKCDPLSKMHTEFYKFLNKLNRDQVMKVYTDVFINGQVQGDKNEFRAILNTYNDVRQVEVNINNQYQAMQYEEYLNELTMSRTKDLINNVFKKEDYTIKTPLIFTNFISFSDSWEYPFALKRYARNNKVFFMMDRKGHFYYDFDKKTNTEYIILNFKTPGYKMALVRTNKRKYKGPPTNHWSKFQTNYKVPDHTLIKIPAFKIEAEHELETVFGIMGLGILFDKERANFSSTGKEHPQCMSRFFVKTYIDVNQFGATASAVTVVAQHSPKRPKPPPTSSYHSGPFSVYLIAHDYVVFHARIEDPTVIVQENTY